MHSKCCVSKTTYSLKPGKSILKPCPKLDWGGRGTVHHTAEINSMKLTRISE